MVYSRDNPSPASSMATITPLPPAAREADNASITSSTPLTHVDPSCGDNTASYSPSIAPSESASTRPATNLSTSATTTSSTASATPADKKWSGFASEQAYLSALSSWAEDKKYVTLGDGSTQLSGYYGSKTMGDYIASGEPLRFPGSSSNSGSSSRRKSSSANTSVAGGPSKISSLFSGFNIKNKDAGVSMSSTGNTETAGAAGGIGATTGGLGGAGTAAPTTTGAPITTTDDDLRELRDEDAGESDIAEREAEMIKEANEADAPAESQQPEQLQPQGQLQQGHGQGQGQQQQRRRSSLGNLLRRITTGERMSEGQ